MKLRKIMAGVVASALAASTLAVAASAQCLTKIEGTEAALSTGTGAWLIQLYSKGNEAEGKPATKLDIDYSKIAALTFTFQVNEEDKELWDGTIGGSVVFSCNGEKLGVQNDPDAAKAALYDKYNWPGCEFWGVLDEELLGPVGEGSTLDDTKPAKTEKVGDYTEKRFPATCFYREVRFSAPPSFTIASVKGEPARQWGRVISSNSERLEPLCV